MSKDALKEATTTRGSRADSPKPKSENSSRPMRMLSPLTTADLGVLQELGFLSEEDTQVHR